MASPFVGFATSFLLCVILFGAVRCDCTTFSSNATIALGGGEVNDTISVDSQGIIVGTVLRLTFSNVDFSDLVVDLESSRSFRMSVFDGTVLCGGNEVPPLLNISFRFACDGIEQDSRCPLDDSSLSSYVPDTPFSRVDGSERAGNWTLYVSQGNSTATPELLGWELLFCDDGFDLSCNSTLGVENKDPNVWELIDLWVVLFFPLLCVLIFGCVLCCLVIVIVSGATVSSFVLGSYYAVRMATTDIDYL